MSPYVTRQAVLEEAGLSQRAVQESPALGVADGTNTIFTTRKAPLSDTAYDDAVDNSDVVAYVNGSAVPVKGVNADTGAITLVSAPANGATVLLTYRFQSVTDANVDDVICEAQDLIDTTMASVDQVPYETVPATVKKICRVYAAGLLLTRDYGFSSDTADTSKDGYKKLEMVEGKGQEGNQNYMPGWLSRWLTNGGQSGNTSDAGSGGADVISDPNVFDNYDQTTGKYSNGSSNMSPDQIFMLGTDMDD